MNLQDGYLHILHGYKTDEQTFIPLANIRAIRSGKKWNIGLDEQDVIYFYLEGLNEPVFIAIKYNGENKKSFLEIRYCSLEGDLILPIDSEPSASIVAQDLMNQLLKILGSK